MDYYNYINQRQSSLHGRQSDFSAGDVASLRFSAGDSDGEARYSGVAGLLAHCGTAAFTGGGLHHRHEARLDGFALTNGELSPSRDASSYGRAFTRDASNSGDVYGGGQSTPVTLTVNNHHSESTTPVPLHAQPQRLRYLPPPPGTALPPLDGDDDAAATEENDDDDAASLQGDGRSSVSSTPSNTSDYRHTTAAPPVSYNDGILKAEGNDETKLIKSDQTSVVAVPGLTSTQPLIYPWMRRVHSSNNGMHNWAHVLHCQNIQTETQTVRQTRHRLIANAAFIRNKISIAAVTNEALHRFRALYSIFDCKFSLKV